MIILRRPGRSARVLLAAGLLALMASVAPTLAHAQTPDRSRLSTILLVRHAEKAGLSGNVPLNDA